MKVRNKQVGIKVYLVLKRDKLRRESILKKSNHKKRNHGIIKKHFTELIKGQKAGLGCSVRLSCQACFRLVDIRARAAITGKRHQLRWIKRRKRGARVAIKVMQSVL